jgi:hypothetical protein
MSQKLNANAGRHVVLAITGYFRSIAHGSDKDGDGSLQVSSLHFPEMKVLTSMMKMSVLVCRYDKEPICSGLKLPQCKAPAGKLLHQSSLLGANCWFPLSVKDFTLFFCLPFFLCFLTLPKVDIWLCGVMRRIY